MNDKSVSGTASAMPGLSIIIVLKYYHLFQQFVSAIGIIIRPSQTQLFQSFFPITDIATYRMNQPRGQII